MRWDIRALAAQAWAQRRELLFGIGRFPVAVAALALFVVAVNLEIAEVTALGTDGLTRLGTATSAAAAIAAACILFFESRDGQGQGAHLLSLALALALALGAAIWWWRELAVASGSLLLAAALLVPLAPYARRRAGFWSFVWALANAVALAFLAIAIFCAGLSAILASLEYLFGIDVDGSVYGHVWSTGLGFVGPIFALSQVPAGFPQEDAPDPRDFIIAGIRVLADFVAVPLIAVYALILHAYALKIVLEAELPRGQIGWMVLSLGLAVLALRMIVDPFAPFARAPTRLFLRFWAWILPVPLVLLAIAVAERIGLYGVTPERYALALFGLFLGIVLAVQVVPRLRGDIRIVPALGALLLVATAFGPWGLVDLSARQQAARLYASLAAAGALDGGRLAATPDVPPSEARSLASIVRLLDELGQLDRLEPLFAGRDDDPFGAAEAERVREITRILAVDSIPVTRGPDGSFWAGPGTPGLVALDGFDLVLPYLAWSEGQPPLQLEGSGLAIAVTTSSDALTIAAAARTLVVPAAAFADELRDLTSESLPQRDGMEFPLLTFGQDGIRVGILFDNVAGHIGEDGSVAIRGGRFQLFLRAADWR